MRDVVRFKADLVFMTREQAALADDKQQLSLMQYIVARDDVENFALVVENTSCNLGQLLAMPQETAVVGSPLYGFFFELVSANHLALFKAVFARQAVWARLIDEETLALVVEILAEQALAQDRDMTEYFALLLESEAAHRVFAACSFDERLSLLESVLLLKGAQLARLIEFVRGCVLEEDQEAVFEHQCARLSEAFSAVYGLLAAQPYALSFFLVFPRVIQEERAAREDDQDSGTLDELVRVWQAARDALDDEDFGLFLHEQPARALALVRDFDLTDGLVASTADEVLATFILKLKTRL